ncbi:MAG: hypothetical protein ACXWOH_05835 [Bdellovibrionota bacterium]
MTNLILASLLILGAQSAQAAGATSFDTTHFVNPGEFAIGVEPIVTVTNGAGIGFNGRYTQGLTDLINVTGLIGTGTGPQQFRAGANATFDFFPDAPKQPGIGISPQFTFFQSPVASQFEISAAPYIHKIFTVKGYDIEPFISVPLGIDLAIGGSYQLFVKPSIGTIFKMSDHFRAVAELGVGIGTDTTVSGGIVYYH